MTPHRSDPRTRRGYSRLDVILLAAVTDPWTGAARQRCPAIARDAAVVGHGNNPPVA